MASSLRHVHVLLLCLTASRAQTISTSAEIPPLQWVNLTRYLQGPSAPPLKDASIGYDNISRNLLIFGGESEGGFVQSNTYLLNLDTLIWTKPSSPANLQTSPSPRSAALSGDDFAASNRHAHVLIGGKNANSALSDVWEFDYNNQFWAEVNISPGGPSPRWGASGGIDTQVAPVNDPSGIPGPNNTIYLAGGTDGNGPIAISDVWELHLSGTLSSNLPNSSEGSWQHSPIGKLPAIANQAGTVVGKQIVAAGGCNTSSVSNDSCALQSSYVLDIGVNSQISPGSCPAPRVGAALAQNFNGFSSSFSSQVFLLLGTFNDSLWDDGGGSHKGEVAILDVNAGTWSRILPSGDPGTSGNVAFPSPREGAAVLSFPTNLVGNTKTTASDTIVFGGRDATGKYLSEVWLLRAYNGAVTSSNQKWSGFGDGKLQTGVNANGAGVVIQYMTGCASAIAAPSSSSSPTSRPSPSATQPGTQSSEQFYDISTTHEILAPLSIGLLLPAIILLRLASPSSSSSNPKEHNIAPSYISAFIGIGAYGVGIAGLVSSFTTIRSTASIQKRSSSNLTLKTGHGVAGLALFICLYGLVPFLYLLRACRRLLHRRWTKDKAELPQARDNSIDTREKLALANADSASVTQSAGIPTPPASPRRRVPSWGGYSLWQGSRTQEPRASSDTESHASLPAAQPRAFEVVNRPQRTRRASTNGPNLRGSSTQRTLVDLDWLERRRSLNAVGELDYAMSQASRTQGTTPATADLQSQLALMTKGTEPPSQPEMPHPFDIILRIIFHLLLLALSILSLVALWSLSSRAGFAVFLAWTSAFYVLLFLCAWYGKPRKSILTVIISRLLASPSHAPQPTPSSLPLTAADQFPFPTDTRGPYVHHQPPYRAAGTDDVSITHGVPRSAENDDEEEDDADEDTMQQRIEDEMARRDVSIITVPRKKLWITNPEAGDPS